MIDKGYEVHQVDWDSGEYMVIIHLKELLIRLIYPYQKLHR